MRVALVLCLLVTGLHTAASAQAQDKAAPALPAKSASLDSIKVFGERDQVRLKAEMATIGEVEVPGLREWQRRKSAKVAVMSNMVLPGLGQVYNGRRLKAVTMIGLFTYYTGRAWIERKNQIRAMIERDKYPSSSIEYKYQNLLVDYHRETMKDHIWWAGATYLIGMLDAFVDAHLYDVRAVDPAIIRSLNDKYYMGLSVQL